MEFPFPDIWYPVSSIQYPVSRLQLAGTGIWLRVCDRKRVKRKKKKELFLLDSRKLRVIM